jgi:hypothetical protein
MSRIVLGSSTLLMCRKSPGEVRRRRRSGRQFIWKAAVVRLTEELLLVIQILVYVWVWVVTVLYRFPLDVVRGSSRKMMDHFMDLSLD